MTKYFRSRPTFLGSLAISLLSWVFAAVAPAQGVAVGEVLRAQIALDLANFSPGAIDGMWGANTRGALRAFQSARGLEPSGELDEETREALRLDREDLLVEHVLTAQDLAGPFVDEIPESPMDQAKLESLAYTSAAEALAEQFHLDRDTLLSLNPDIELEEGATIRVANLAASAGVASGSPGESAGPVEITVDKSDSFLEVRDAENTLRFYAPGTAGSSREPLPLGEWRVESIGIDPVYHYDPALLADADPADEEVSLPAGPNNPVGVVWIGIDKEHYGIHGTPEPSEIGYTGSSGCVRLTNWDARKLAHMVSAGSKVLFRE